MPPPIHYLKRWKSKSTGCASFDFQDPPKKPKCQPETPQTEKKCTQTKKNSQKVSCIWLFKKKLTEDYKKMVFPLQKVNAVFNIHYLFSKKKLKFMDFFPSRTVVNHEKGKPICQKLKQNGVPFLREHPCVNWKLHWSPFSPQAYIINFQLR